MAKRPYYHINSLEKATNILNLLATAGELSVSEIGKKLGMHRSATHRFLATLKNLGYLEQSEDSSYRLSFKLFELGMSVANRIETRKVVHPFLIDLRARHEETANFAIMEGLDIVYIDKVESPHLLRMDLAVGCRVPAYCTALGRVMLAYRSENDVVRLFRGFKFTPRTPKTISNLPNFLEKLREIRKEGYAVNDEEFELGIRGLAVPIFNYTGNCIASIGLAGPTVRISDGKIAQMKEDLIAVGKTISIRLGNPSSISS
jgi:DNA-binding IclR family transcriptional regulator